MKLYDAGDNEWYDYVSEREADEDSFMERYADDINGNAVYPDEPRPEPVAEQLALFGAALR